ncbi:MAG: glycine--tRNA ligase [Candidatus Micrarchaeota archaeon]
MAKKQEMDAELANKVINLCQRRGILVPSCEIYGSHAGFFDYGPLGAQLKRNLENNWWNRFVTSREDVVAMDGALVSPRPLWKASGHLDSFNDPLVECRKCGLRTRADHLAEDELKINVDGLSVKHLQDLIHEHKVKCPKCGGELSPIRTFSLMFKTHVGATADEAAEVYLRPETAQLIFANYKLVQFVSRKQLPFGIAQIGKAFRNEIAPRNFVFRCREFSQMEIEYFMHPGKLDDCPLLDAGLLDKKMVFFTQNQAKETKPEKMTLREALDNKVVGTRWHAYWLAASHEWLVSLGLRASKLRLRQHTKDELSHYSSETWDVEYEYPWGWKELMGIANRTDFDLKQHAKASGKDLSYHDQATNEKVVPFVIEPSLGVDRLLFTLLIDAYNEKGEGGEVKTILSLSPTVAPVLASVFPLMKKDGLAEKAREVFNALKQEGFACEYDESGSIGRRYARSDEAGTPACITVDYQTLEDNTVTLRDRDSGKQERIAARDLAAALRKTQGF